MISEKKNPTTKGSRVSWEALVGTSVVMAIAMLMIVQPLFEWLRLHTEWLIIPILSLFEGAKP